MWMQNSVEGSSFSSSGNLHDRNRFGSQYAQRGSYNGNPVSHESGDWKTKILESGQWLGGKVIEYGGKLARGPTTNSIPDQYAHQMPRNDGRADWMAEIRSSSSSHAGRGGTGNYTGGYQNDFVTERPKTYSDYSQSHSRNSLDSKSYGKFDLKTESLTDNSDLKKKWHGKKKKNSKESKKKSKKKRQSDSDSDVQSARDELSISESSEMESMDERRHKSKGKTKKKKNTSKHSENDLEGCESDHNHTKKKTLTDYSFSFDPAKLPHLPAEDQGRMIAKKKKATKHKNDKAGKKSRTRRYRIASTDNESSTSENENLQKTKKRVSKALSMSNANVDLLGVDLDVQPVAQATTSGCCLAHEVHTSVFDTPQSQSQNPLQELAGLNFAAPAEDPIATQPPVVDGNALAATSDEKQKRPDLQNNAFRTNLLPENNIVDLNSLVCDKRKTLSANPDEKRTLNDMQKARGASQPVPAMSMPTQGQQHQNMPGSMMQLNMNQLQITDGATEMQQRMYPNMHMQTQMPMPAQIQPQMMMVQPQVMMTQPQVAMTMHPQMMHLQLFAQGSATRAEQPAATNFSSSDPFHSLP